MSGTRSTGGGGGHDPGGHRASPALRVFAGTSWLAPPRPDVPARVVAICGDDAEALGIVSGLVRDLGGVPAVVGDLGAARQLEATAGFVMRVVGAGHEPAAAMPLV